MSAFLYLYFTIKKYAEHITLIIIIILMKHELTFSCQIISNISNFSSS